MMINDLFQSFSIFSRSTRLTFGPRNIPAPTLQADNHPNHPGWTYGPVGALSSNPISTIIVYHVI